MQVTEELRTRQGLEGDPEIGKIREDTTSLGWRKSEEGATAVHGLGPEEEGGGIRVGLFARTDSLRKHSHLFLKRTLQVKGHEENYSGFSPQPLSGPHLVP